MRVQTLTRPQVIIYKPSKSISFPSTRVPVRIGQNWADWICGNAREGQEELLKHQEASSGAKRFPQRHRGGPEQA